MPPIEGGMEEKPKNIQPSWAEQMEEGNESFHRSLPVPPDTERYEGDTKIVTHYEFDEDLGKIKKYTRYYKIQKIKVPKSIAVRKSWKKFGKASHDPPGINPSNTQVTDEVVMDFIRPETESKINAGIQEETLKNAKAGKGLVKCRYCDMDHWSTLCPYKDKLQLIQPKDEAGPSSQARLDDGGAGKGRYVPPSMRGGDATGRKGEMMGGGRSRDEANTIRVTNLPEDIQDNDLKELFHKFGRISRIFLAKDKYTGQSKGFAFVSFENRHEAAKAIATVNGHGYANLILTVEWAKPSGKE